MSEPVKSKIEMVDKIQILTRAMDVERRRALHDAQGFQDVNAVRENTNPPEPGFDQVAKTYRKMIALLES